MGILSIKIKIGDKDYPMKIDESEEEVLRTAGKILNERLKSFREQYSTENTQDLLAMLAFDCLVTEIKNKQKTLDADAQLVEKMSYLNNLISKTLSN
jgi:cell division protein ZapA